MNGRGPLHWESFRRPSRLNRLWRHLPWWRIHQIGGRGRLHWQCFRRPSRRWHLPWWMIHQIGGRGRLFWQFRRSFRFRHWRRLLCSFRFRRRSFRFRHWRIRIRCENWRRRLLCSFRCRRRSFRFRHWRIRIRCENWRRRLLCSFRCRHWGPQQGLAKRVSDLLGLMGAPGPSCWHRELMAVGAAAAASCSYWRLGTELGGHESRRATSDLLRCARRATIDLLLCVSPCLVASTGLGFFLNARSFEKQISRVLDPDSSREAPARS